jgi:metallo-beta-lactamase class B
MLGPALVASALVSAVVAWGLPATVPPPSPPSLSSPSAPLIFGPDTALDPAAKIDGDINKEIIRRIIRRHINDVKSCYAQELSRAPALAGKIDVQFTIAASGQVVASVLQHSTMGNARVETCTVEAVRHWQFPKVAGGGSVIITYPFILTPAEVTKLVAGTNGAGAVEIEAFDSTLFVHRSSDADAVPSNGLVAVTERGLLLVDTAWTDAETEAVLAWGAQRFHLPWIGAVITHDHNDRDGGLAALERRHIPVAALDLTVAKLTRRGVRGVTTLFLARDGALKDPRGFEAFYPGPGHASDNIVLHFPGLVYGGCLVKSMGATDLGFTADADLAAWPAAVRNVRARYTDRAIVPGHGAMDLTGQAYQHTLDLLAAANRGDSAKR